MGVILINSKGRFMHLTSLLSVIIFACRSSHFKDGTGVRRYLVLRRVAVVLPDIVLLLLRSWPGHGL